MKHDKLKINARIRKEMIDNKMIDLDLRKANYTNIDIQISNL